MVIGGLLAVLSGGCILLFGADDLIEGQFKTLGFLAVFGGVPFAIGAWLFAWGRGLLPKKSEGKENQDS